MQIGTLLKVKGDAINNYARRTSISWDYPRKTGMYISLAIGNLILDSLIEAKFEDVAQISS